MAPPVLPEQILEPHAPLVRETAERLRALLRETVEELTERAYPGWHGIGYRHPEAGYVCGIFPQERSVKLYFERGALLSDPEGILRGTGKQTRFVEVGRPEEIPAEGIVLLLLEAIAR